MLRILFVVPYGELEEVVKQSFEELLPLWNEEISYRIIEVPTGNLRIESDEADVVIARGYTAAHLTTSLPTINLPVSTIDMIKAIENCITEHSCRKIAFVGVPALIHKVSSLAELIREVEILGHTVMESESLDAEIERLREQGVDAVIGGRSVRESAQRIHMPYTILSSGKEAVYSAIEEALTALKYAEKEKEKREYFQAIMDYSFEGIITTDTEGKILSVNRYALEKLKTDYGSEQMLGMEVSAFFPELKLEKREHHTFEKLMSYEDMRFMVNCVPLAAKEISEGWIITFRDIEVIQKTEGKIRKQLYAKGLSAKYSFADLNYTSRIMADTVRIAQKYAKAQSNVFIHGETGTGKELFAQSIHNASSRSAGPFVAVNCAALPESILESELFGYVEGAFTGAVKGGKAGLFELAHGGTLFLDEIGEMAVSLQARLLRVLQEKEIRRLGGDQVIPVDVRIITASHRDMDAGVRNGEFRQDLLYRIRVLSLELPPLRKRGNDILDLARTYIERERLRNGSRLKVLDKEVQEWMLRQPWEGNVRELRNFCERLSVLCEQETAFMDDVENAAGYHVGEHITADKEKPKKKEDEKERILRALERNGYSKKDTASELGIDTSTLWRKMKKYSL